MLEVVEPVLLLVQGPQPVVDALRPWGVNNIDMPATPERVWRAIHSDGTLRTPTGTVSYGGASTAATAGAAGDATSAKTDGSAL